MNASEYLQESEHALKQLFEGIAYYSRILEEMQMPIFVSDIPFNDNVKWSKAFATWHKNNKHNIEKSADKSREYFGHSFSNATLCGSILQIASMAIESFSQNNLVPGSCSGFIGKSKSAVKFCAGREVRGLPIGIVVYAARNQYNHWDDPTPHDITKAVFNALSLGHGYGEFVDPAFDLANPNLQIYSHNILALLEWKSYEDFKRDIFAIV